MAKGGAGLLPLGSLMVQIIYDNSGAMAGVKVVDTAVAATGKQIDAHMMKLRNLWAYGNQMISLILNLTRQAVKGTAEQAKVTEALSITQFAQGEYAVAITAKQAAAAYALPGGVGIPQGIILTAIATSMQVMNIVALANREQAARIRRQAEELKQYVDQYRS